MIFYIKHSGLGLALVLGLVSCKLRAPEQSQLKSASAKIGDYRGFEQYVKLLRSRVFSQTQKLYDYDITVMMNGQFKEFTGVHRGDVINSRKINFEPKGFSVLIWHDMATNLSTNLADLACKPLPPNIADSSDSDVQKINPYLLKNLHTICHAKLFSPQVAEAVNQVYRIMMRDFKAEKQPWVAYFLGEDSPYQQKYGRDYVTDLTSSLLLNPYFILRRG